MRRIATVQTIASMVVSLLTLPKTLESASWTVRWNASQSAL